MQRTISFDLSWQQAANIIALALENGTGEGKAHARAELQRMAQILDHYRAAENGERATPDTFLADGQEAPAEETPQYGVAMYGPDERPRAYYRSTRAIDWTTEAQAELMTREDADLLAHDLTERAASKGMALTYRARKIAP